MPLPRRHPPPAHPSYPFSISDGRGHYPVTGLFPKPTLTQLTRVAWPCRSMRDNIGARPAPDVVTLTHVTRPSTTTDGLHAPALAFGDPRVMALLAALVLFTHALDGLRQPPAGQAGRPPMGS